MQNKSEIIEDRQYFYNKQKLIETIKNMLAVEPILSNLFSITLCVAILVLIGHPNLLPKLGKYYIFLGYAIKASIALQFIKSATKSYLLPIIALIFAGCGFMTINYGLAIFPVSVDTLKVVMLIGVLGIILATFCSR